MGSLHQILCKLKIPSDIGYRHIYYVLGPLFKSLKNCHVQSQLQVKISLKTELALFSLNPATHPTHPATHPRGKVYFPTFLSECRLSKLTGVGRQTQQFDKQKATSIFGKWKTTSIFSKMENDLNSFGNERASLTF